MGFKIFALILLLSATSALGFSLENVELSKNGSARLTEFGPQIADLINNIVKGLPDPMPILDFTSYPLRLDLTKIFANSSVPIKGKMNISMLDIKGLSGFKVDKSSLILNGIVSPLPFNFILDLKSLKIGLGYSMDAILSNIIPLRGKGDITIGFDSLGLELLGSISSAIGLMKLKGFTFTTDIQTLRIHLGGLMGDEQLADAVSEILTQYVAGIKIILGLNIAEVIQNIVVPVLTPLTVEKVTRTFDSQNLTLSKLQDLLKPKPEMAQFELPLFTL